MSPSINVKTETEIIIEALGAQKLFWLHFNPIWQGGGSNPPPHFKMIITSQRMSILIRNLLAIPKYQIQILPHSAPSWILS